MFPHLSWICSGLPKCFYMFCFSWISLFVIDFPFSFLDVFWMFAGVLDSSWISIILCEFTQIGPEFALVVAFGVSAVGKPIELKFTVDRQKRWSELMSRSS